ncbi:hypothetical protein [Litoreibacter roseus]|uniref:Uncharacterized protein n=1 Tax=Litoreibacter roseus TaxID=2601869 RepID=A0A6N6JAW8_9RHOB|nr:hypothetical protein [Litoreibacter roseus]GFE63137.1 hypothetical protein KIN_02110 [Litoreibacter roseus]
MGDNNKSQTVVAQTHPVKGSVTASFNFDVGSIGIARDQDGVVSESLSWGRNVTIDSGGTEWGWSASVPAGPLDLSVGQTFKEDGTYGTAGIDAGMFSVGIEPHEDNPITHWDATASTARSVARDGTVVENADSRRINGQDHHVYKVIGPDGTVKEHVVPMAPGHQLYRGSGYYNNFVERHGIIDPQYAELQAQIEAALTPSPKTGFGLNGTTGWFDGVDRNEGNEGNEATATTGSGRNGTKGWFDGQSGNEGNEGNESNEGNGGRDSSGGKPILLDLDGDGVEITELSKSTVFMDAGGDGLLHRTAWAAAGDAVLVFDDDGDGAISEKKEYVFTEWDPTAKDDLAALRAVFDSNDDGVLNASDAQFADFKLLVTNPDGSTEAKTLAELGIAEIDLTADTTRIELPDGSMITGQTTFTRTDGTIGTVANATLFAEAQGYKVDQIESTDGSGNRVVVSTAYAATGDVAYRVTSVTSFDGANITNSYDDNGDGAVDRTQTITTVTNSDGSRTETVANYSGAILTTAILTNQVVTTTSSDGTDVLVQRDSTGGGWFDQEESRITNVDGSRSIVVNDLAEDGSVIRGSSEITLLMD